MYPILLWPVDDGQNRITQFWGENADDYKKFGLNGHNGLDISVPEGTPVRACAGGWVREAMDGGSLGLYVKVMHDWGHTVYAHLSELRVKNGDTVKPGQVIGLSGNTGNSTGPHLHLGVRINPYNRGDGWLGYSNPLPLLQQPRTGAGLAAHWIPSHRDADDDFVMRRWQPASVKVFENGWSNPELLTMLYRDMQNSLIVWRDWPLSEQHDDMVEAPVDTGKRHVQEWMQKFANMQAKGAYVGKARTVFLGINEPKVWESLSETVSYTIAFLEELEKNGFRGGALNLSTGWPANSGPDTRPYWEPYAELERVIQRGGHYLFLHDYWDIAGPGEMWGWWAGRSLACPWNVPIIIGECGVDRYVQGGDFQGTRGWQGNMNSEDYWRQLTEYEQWMTEDSRIHSLQVFTYDVGSRIWNTFDVRPIRDKLAAHGELLRTTARPWVRGDKTAPPLPYVKPSPPQPEPDPTPPEPTPPTNDLAELEKRVTALENWVRSFR